MGNFASCVSPDVSKLSVKVVHPDGKMEEFRRSVVVAELMMEHPNHFVCHSSALTNINKKSMLSAEIELEAGRLYYLLPYDKFQGILTPEVTDAPGNKPARAVNAIQQLAQAKFEIQNKANSMVTRVTIKGDDLSHLLSEVGKAAGRRTPLVSYSSPDLRSLYTNQLLTRSNSWKPMLETIQEVVAVSRSKKQRVHNWEDTSAEDSRPSEPQSAVVSPKASIKEAAVVPLLSTPPQLAAAPKKKGKPEKKKSSFKKSEKEQSAKPQGPVPPQSPGVYTELFPMVVQVPPRRVQAVN
ncbi:hypothetical protein Mapa_005036 [Marchantia paleacea]|nr:hypothetical protein Mapa_005036 [Marchantia paleacea]